jgi:hypothetical protein
MTQLRGEGSVTGHVKVRCDQGCGAQGLEFHVVFCSATHDLNGRPLQPKRDLTS